MLPRRVKKEKPAAPPPVVKPKAKQEPDPVEVLQSQIAEDRAKAAPGSRSGERRTIKTARAGETDGADRVLVLRQTDREEHLRRPPQGLPKPPRTGTLNM